MKQIAQYQDGRLELQDVPAPRPPPAGVLVRTTHSVISIGTERMKVEQAKMSLVQKARARPDQVRKVLDTARTLGWKSAYEKVMNRLQTPTPLGYSAAGVVVEVDPGQTRLRVGDRVACGGAECAHHAEFIAIPDMLCARIPDNVDGGDAAYTTVASIAMQAVRQAGCGLGERAVVIGQGLIGLLVTNLLAASGVHVMAVDVVSSRRALCTQLGAERVVIAGEQNLADEVHAWTGGYGADCVLVCTATSSNEPIEQAGRIARDRGRLVIVGITKVELPRGAFYDKELDIRYSRSYGPGRYDASYEWGGADYPIGYVRWTEQRHFDECLALMAQKKLRTDLLTTRRVPFAQSIDIYEKLGRGEVTDIGIVLEYDGAGAVSVPAAARSVAAVVGAQGRISPVAKLHVIGAGNFARTMLLPHVKDKIALGTVVNATALSANHVKARFGFEGAETDAKAVLAKDDGAAVLVATRHHLHAPIVLEALAKGRHVFVEKPLCLTEGEMDLITAAVKKGGSVHVGFNRRFSPVSVELKNILRNIAGPKTVVCKVVPGRLDPQSWYANVAESGGRVLGEACHFFDYLCFLIGQKPARVTAQTTWPAEGRLPFADSVAAQIEFADGSCGQLPYTAEASTKYPKETISAFASGVSAEITNFQRLEVWRSGGSKVWTCGSKGHAEQVAAWLAYLTGESEPPLLYDESRQSMALTFAALASIRERRTIELAG